MKKILPWYSILVGLSIIATWTLFYASGRVPGMEDQPVQTAWHIAAEFAAAAALLAGGIGLLRKRPWGAHAHFLALGMLLYAIINSPGYYHARGDTLMLAVFAGSGAAALTAIALSFLYLNENK
jgi:hypothetical protein